MFRSILKILPFTCCCLLLVGLQACQNKNNQPKQLREEVMKTHDELMMDMDKIMNNKSALSQIQNKLDSLKQRNITLDTATLNSEIISIKSKLDVSDDAMMKWMNNFNPDDTGKTPSEIVTYLSAQKIKIDAVKTLFTKSLSKSDSLIAKYK